MKISLEERKELIEMARAACYSEYDYVICGCCKTKEEKEEMKKEWAWTLTDEGALKRYRRTLRTIIEWGIENNVTVTVEDLKNDLRGQILLQW